MRHWKLLEAMTQQGITPSRTVPACQFAQPDQYGNEATDKLVGGFPGAMEHQVRAIVNPSDAGMSAVHAGVGVAHLGRFRALAGASRAFGRGLWARPHRCSILSRSARVAVARQNTSIQEPKVTKMTMTKFHVLAIAVGPRDFGIEFCSASVTVRVEHTFPRRGEGKPWHRDVPGAGASI
jgi:hypothetical protein